VKEADDPKLADLKKLLKRLEKIDPETRGKESAADGKEPGKTTPRRSPDAILDRPANDAAPVDGLLQLKPRNGSGNGNGLGRNRDAVPSELPVIVTQTLPATRNSGSDPGAVHVVIIASITAAIVSALATAGTVYWLNLESNRLAYTAPAGQAAPAGIEAPARQLAGASPVEPPPAGDPAAPATAASQPATMGAPVETSREQAADSAADRPLPAASSGNAAQSGAARHASVVLAEPGQPAAEARGNESDPDLAAAATPGSASAGSSISPRSAGVDAITPPQPRLAGEPGQTASTKGEPASSGQAKLGSGLQLGPPQSAVAIGSAREIVAALTSSNAVAAESKGPSEIEETRPAAGFLGAATLVGPGERGALSSLAGRETLKAEAETKAPTVAVFEAPSEAPPEDIPPAADPPAATPAPAAAALDQPAAADAQKSGAADEKVAIAANEMPPAPQLGAGEVALWHPAEATVGAEGAIAFPLAVLGTEAELRDHYLIVSGLKRGARPSAGFELMFDTWRINVADLPGLKLSVPAGFARRMHLVAELRRPDGSTREKTAFVLAMPGAASSLVGESEEASGLPASVRRSVDDGEVQIDNGSLSAARLLFQRAALAGSARGAMLLAATYDPNFVTAFKMQTPPKPDNGEARRWYARAAELGAPSARERLQRLPAG